MMSSAPVADLYGRSAFLPALALFHSRFYESRVFARRMRAPRASRRQALVVGYRFPDGRSARIPLSQTYPFLKHRRELETRHDMDLSFTYIDRVPEICAERQFDVICFQTTYDIEPTQFEQMVETFRTGGGKPRLVLLDSFAPTDLRLASVVDSQIALYIKKHVLRDLGEYARPTYGDTNLTDHFNRRFLIEAPLRHFPIPEGFFDKLIVGPTFFTGPFLSWIFERSPVWSPSQERPIDVHARMECSGTAWYAPMRLEARRAVESLHGRRVVTEPDVRLSRYLSEMMHSKIVFSPFGYGEVCWRDCEAFALGALLLKPDMSHVRTDPDLFVPFETYVPVRWDLSDLEERVDYYCNHPDERAAITQNAYERLHRYVSDGGFVAQMARVFSPAS